jgi:2-(1,2-epoxy-1,2-dihydrophenyl)acetyl-CoA isomerase
MNQSQKNNIDFKVENGIALVSICDPKTRNSLSFGVLDSLMDCMEEISDSDNIRVAIIRGANGFFSSGGNVKSMNDSISLCKPRKTFNSEEVVRRFGKAIWSVRDCKKPVIAWIEGIAAGAAVSLALACDFRYMAEDAQLIGAFTNVGLMADSGICAMLMQLCGYAFTLDFTLTGRPVGAEECLRLGLVNGIAPAGELEPIVMNLAEKFAKGPTLAYTATKECVNIILKQSFNMCVDFEAKTIPILRESADHKEGVLAFQQKRPAVYTGR